MHIDWWTLALQTVNVLVLIWILGRFFFRPVADLVAKRQAETRKGCSPTPRRLASETADLEGRGRQGAGQHRGRSETSCWPRRAQAAQAEKAALLAQSRYDIAKQRSEAEAAMARERTRAEQAIVTHASELAVDIARRLLGRMPAAVSFAAFLDGLCDELRNLSPETHSGLATGGARHRHRCGSAADRRTKGASAGDPCARILGANAAFTFHDRSGADRRHRAARAATPSFATTGAPISTGFREDLKRDGHDVQILTAGCATPRPASASQRSRRPPNRSAVSRAVADGIALVSGLTDVRLDELVRFEHGQVGYTHDARSGFARMRPARRAGGRRSRPSGARHRRGRARAGRAFAARARGRPTRPPARRRLRHRRRQS